MDNLDIKEIDNKIEVYYHSYWQDSSFTAEVLDKFVEGSTEYLICKNPNGDFFCVRKVNKGGTIIYQEILFWPKEIVKLVYKNLNGKGKPNGTNGQDKTQESGETSLQEKV